MMFTLGMLVPIIVSVLVLLVILWLARLVMSQCGLGPPGSQIVLALIVLLWLIGLLHYLGVA